MIITTHKKLIEDESQIGAGIIDVSYDKEKFIIIHGQKVNPMLEKAYDLRTHGDNGFTEDRNFRQIGAIPDIEFNKHPEWMHEPDLIKKWLNTDEGFPYRTVNKKV